MADLPPPGSPNQAEADDASGRDTDYENTESGDDSPGTSANEGHAESEDDDYSTPIREVLESQKAGEFDFDRDPVIKGPADFVRRLHEYETMNDNPRADTTIPTDAPTLGQYAREYAEAIPSLDRAIDTENKANASGAVNYLNRLKALEIELKSWEAIVALSHAQQGRVSVGAWGNDRLPYEYYKSFRERAEAFRETLQLSKNVARNLFQRGYSYMQETAASPRGMLKRHTGYKKSNVRRGEGYAVSTEAHKLAQSRQQDPSRPLNATPTLVEAFREVLAKKPVQAHGSRQTRPGRPKKNNALPSSSTAEKQKQPSSVPRRTQAEPRNAQPTVPNDRETSLTAPGGGTQSTPTSHNGGRYQHRAHSGYIGPVAREAIARLRGREPQPKPSAVNPFLPESVGKEFLPPVPYPTPPVHYSCLPNSAKKRKYPSAQTRDGPVKRQKRHTTRDDTPSRRNGVEGSLGTSRGNKRSTASPWHDLTKTSSQSATTGSTGRKPFPEYPGHEPQREAPMDHESIAKPADNEMSIQPVLRLWPPSASQRPGQTSRAPPTNSRSAAARLPSATAQPRLRSPNGLSLSRDVHPGDDPIAPSGSRYPAKKKKKKKKKNPPSQPRDGASAPSARGPDATARFRKIRRQDGNDYYCEQNDYEGEADEE